MIAHLKGHWVVEIIEEGIHLSALSTSPPPRTSQTTESGERESSFQPAVKQLFVLLGTALALIVVAIFRAQSLLPTQWFHSFMLTEFVVLSVANVLIVGLLMEQLFGVPEPGLLFEAFKRLYGSSEGFVLLGFCLTIILLKSVSFARDSTS